MDKFDKIKLIWYSSYKINKLREYIFSFAKNNTSAKIIFIFGCQRSGTTIVQKLISLHTKIKYYGEGDPPYFYDLNSEKHHRLKSLSEVKKMSEHESARHITIKPLYESQNANEITNISTSKAIWVFRHYLDVIDSHIHYYKQDAIEYIRPLFTKNRCNWLNENIPQNIAKFIKQFKIEALTDADAYGLFWIARNSLYWDVKNKENILLINYETLVHNKEEQVSKIYDFIDLPFQKFHIKMIRDNAVAKKVKFTLNQKIEYKCKSIYKQLIEESRNN